MVTSKGYHFRFGLEHNSTSPKLLIITQTYTFEFIIAMYCKNDVYLLCIANGLLIRCRACQYDS
jgi:hypothetical protein